MSGEPTLYPTEPTLQAPKTSQSMIKVGNFVRSKITAVNELRRGASKNPVKVKNQPSIDYGRLKIVKKGSKRD